MPLQIELKTVDKVGKSALAKACEAGNLAAVQRSLNSADVMATSTFGGQTAWHIACLKGNVEIVRTLLESVPDINHRDKTGTSGLHYAVMSGREAVVSLLLACSDIDVNATDNEGNTPLIHACYFNKLSIARLLAARTDLLASHCNKAGYAALHVSSLRSHAGCVRVLLETCGVDANLSNSVDGRTGLMLVGNSLGIAEIFLAQATIDVNQRSKDGNSALMYACLGDHYDVWDRLLAVPAIDVNAQNAAGDSVLAIACKNNNPMLASQIMQLPTADLSTLSADLGPTLLAAACALNNVALVQRLVASPKMDINYQGKGGFSILLQVSAQINTDVAVLDAILAVPGLDTNQRDALGNTSLIHAVRHGHLYLVQRLLAIPTTDVNIANKVLPDFDRPLQLRG
ncbi:ankyrin repeat domain-containing protein 50 [Achlya hypogyna]|uniref:Ankyrin repeat domain-containing protein 50 n=1 Tax=Achlya hypogyna TaxID=1202772 RepID=A0A1V9YIH0_ACHHY|nr:ankyrin repeat domain-containing protein 50 [Achlya hypogyna]